MKKFLSILVISVALILPMGVKAAQGQVMFKCSDQCVDNGDSCQKDCTIAVQSSTSLSLSNFTANLTFSVNGVASNDLKVVEVKPANGWTDASTGTNLSLIATSTPLTGTTVDVATVTVSYPKDAVNCEISLNSPGFSTSTVKPEPEKPVNTGAALPLAILACGAVAAGVVYVVSKKNTKMYKI